MEKIPNHLGIILDGNRRWAKAKKLPISVGHKKGAEVAKNVIRWAKNKGVKNLTLFAFSTENWRRPKREVGFLLNLGKKEIDQDFKKLNQEGVKLRIIGDRKKLPKDVQKSIKELEGLTKNNKKMTVNLALSYGGRAEIIETIKNIVKKKIIPDKITEDTISQNLWTSDLDLLVRTGKEQRISNFLIWQAAYSELYFCNKYWPDFNEKDLNEALQEYVQRKRRFGK